MSKKICQPNQQLKERSSLFRSALLLLLLSFFASLLLWQLKPSQNSQIDPNDHSISLVPVKKTLRPHPAAFKADESEAQRGESPKSLDSRINASPEADGSSRAANSRVTVVAAGVVKLSPEQRDLLKGASAWGGASSEAKALIDSIPEEAFTNDW